VVANRTAANEQSIGPYASRFGSWARSLPAGRTMELQLDGVFAASVAADSGAKINVTYLDNRPDASFVTLFGTQSVETVLSNSGNWKTVSMPLTSALRPDSAGGHIAIRANGGAVIFHMVEVARAVSAAVDAAGFQPSIAPGGLFSIFGNNLAASTAKAEAVPLPLDLGGVKVRVGGLDAPLLFVSPGQINAQMPYEAAPCGPANAGCAASAIVISSGGVSRAPIYATVVAAAPALFTSETGSTIAQNQDYTLNSPQAPAAAGSVVTVFLTGLGAVSNQPPTGTAASFTELSPAVSKFTATVNGLAAPVYFAGLTPGFVGLGQVNLQIPTSLAPGTHPLVVTTGSFASNTGMISTK
jgi:uncharacterized protein (TIGR03437 family)